MYKFYNNNSLGNYVNDCTVRAISLAEGTSWDYTYNKMSDIAQSMGTMMDDRDFIRHYLDSNYKRVPYLPRTVGEVAGEYPDKVLLITMDSHITTSVFGTVMDSFDCRKRIAEDAWIVK
jgi:hypothetical protein